MAKVRQIPLGNYANGVYPFGPIAFPIGLGEFRLTIGRCTTATPTLWPNATTRIAVGFVFSFDEGFTYQPPRVWTPQGGGIKSKNGVELAEESFGIVFSPAPATHMKVTFTVTGGPIRTYCDVDVA